MTDDRVYLDGFSDYDGGLPTRGWSERNGLRVEWSQSRMCHGCDAGSPVAAWRCINCGAPFPLHDFAVWRAKKMLPWRHRWSPIRVEQLARLIERDVLEARHERF